MLLKGLCPTDPQPRRSRYRRMGEGGDERKRKHLEIGSGGQRISPGTHQETLRLMESPGRKKAAGKAEKITGDNLLKKEIKTIYLYLEKTTFLYLYSCLFLPPPNTFAQGDHLIHKRRDVVIAVGYAIELFYIFCDDSQSLLYDCKALHTLLLLLCKFDPV